MYKVAMNNANNAIFVLLNWFKLYNIYRETKTGLKNVMVIVCGALERARDIYNNC